MTSKSIPSVLESELLQACREKQEHAYRELVNLHQKQVRRTVMGMLGATPEAEDVAQETFIRFFRSLDSFKEQAQLSTFLVRIAINLSLNELKKQERKKRWLSFFKKEGPELALEDVKANPDKYDTRQLVQKALQLLEPEFRSVIILRLMDGYSVKETAAILQWPEGTVCSRLARGQKKLKSIIERIG